jgi:hypothetical protein
MHLWGGSNDGVIPAYSASSDAGWARRNKKTDIPASWAFQHCERHYAGDWDHGSLTDPDRVPSVLNYIKQHTP